MGAPVNGLWRGIGSATCLYCGEGLKRGDRYTTTPCLREADAEPTIEVVHEACQARQVLGSIGHQLGLCSCYGGSFGDPPWMTAHEAARAATMLASVLPVDRFHRPDFPRNQR